MKSAHITYDYEEQGPIKAPKRLKGSKQPLKNQRKRPLNTQNFNAKAKEYPCANKRRYPSLELCTSTGAYISAQFKVSLYTYKCKHCDGYHLTSRAPYCAEEAQRTLACLSDTK